MAVPPVVVTVIVPVVAPVGTVVVINVVVAELTVAVVPLNLTVFPEVVVSKFVPVIVTLAPITPGVGEKDVIVGADVVPDPVADIAIGRRINNPEELSFF